MEEELDVFEIVQHFENVMSFSASGLLQLIIGYGFKEASSTIVEIHFNVLRGMNFDRYASEDRSKKENGVFVFFYYWKKSNMHRVAPYLLQKLSR